MYAGKTRRGKKAGPFGAAQSLMRKPGSAKVAGARKAAAPLPPDETDMKEPPNTEGNSSLDWDSREPEFGSGDKEDTPVVDTVNTPDAETDPTDREPYYPDVHRGAPDFCIGADGLPYEVPDGDDGSDNAEKIQGFGFGVGSKGDGDAKRDDGGSSSNGSSSNGTSSSGTPAKDDGSEFYGPFTKSIKTELIAAIVAGVVATLAGLYLRVRTA